MKCDCGFQFSGPGEFRNCNAFMTKKGHWGLICPTCGKKYVSIEHTWYVFDISVDDGV